MAINNNVAVAPPKSMDADLWAELGETAKRGQDPDDDEVGEDDQPEFTENRHPKNFGSASIPHDLFRRDRVLGGEVMFDFGVRVLPRQWEDRSGVNDDNAYFRGLIGKTGLHGFRERQRGVDERRQMRCGILRNSPVGLSLHRGSHAPR
jgi:hypothetical protein